MKADINFNDEKLNELLNLVKQNYERFNTCSINVETKNQADFETADYVHDIDYDQEVTIKLKFYY